MSLTILDRTETLDNEKRRFAERRFQFALSRFDSRIRSVDVTIRHAPVVGEPLRYECRVTVVLKRAIDVILSEQDPDIRTSISRAAQRAGRAVGRSIDRSSDVVSSDSHFHSAGTSI